jgi:hypothetical protein
MAMDMVEMMAMTGAVVVTEGHHLQVRSVIGQGLRCMVEAATLPNTRSILHETMKTQQQSTGQ